VCILGIQKVFSCGSSVYGQLHSANSDKLIVKMQNIGKFSVLSINAQFHCEYFQYMDNFILRILIMCTRTFHSIYYQNS
jgi:hypothetical protein